MQNFKKELKIERALGGQTLHRVKDGFKVKKIASVDGERMKTDPAFRRTMQNAADFKTASVVGKLLREAFSLTIKYGSDGRLANRMTSAMRAILKSDMENLRGQRSVLKGDLGMLNSFQFNLDSPLKTSMLAPYTASIDRESGEAKVSIASYNPDVAIAYPLGATHYVLHIAASAVDFETGKSDFVAFETQPLIINMQQTAPTVLSVQLPANSDKPLFLVMGIYFLQSDNGVLYPLGGKSYNAAAIVDVSHE